MRSLVLPVLLFASLLFTFGACGVKGPPLPPERDTSEISVISRPGAPQPSPTPTPTPTPSPSPKSGK